MPRKKKEENVTGPVVKPQSSSQSKAASAKASPGKAGPKAVKIPKVKTEKTPGTKSPKVPGAEKIAASSRAKTPADKPTIPTSPLKKLQRKGETQMVAFIRDPQCLFTYWEVTPESVESVKKVLQDEFNQSSMVLRVFRKGPEGNVELIQEIFVEPKEMNRYIPVADPQGSYFLEIALKAPSGKVVVYARSNDLTAGPSGFTGSSWAAPSPDPQWETPAGLAEYFSQEEYTETFPAPGGISSADNLKRKRGRFASSNIN